VDLAQPVQEQDASVAVPAQVTAGPDEVGADSRVTWDGHQHVLNDDRRADARRGADRGLGRSDRRGGHGPGERDGQADAADQVQHHPLSFRQ